MRAINASVMRQVNKKLLLNHIRLRPISRAELAEVTNLTRASVTQIIEELIAEGIVIETTVVGRSRLGRRSTQLAIEPRSGMIFGVFLSYTSCDIGVIDMHGNVLTHTTESTVGRMPEEVLDAVAAIIRRQQDELKIPAERIVGVGVCSPGPVDVEKGAILNPEGLERWHNVPVVKMLSERTGFEVRLERTVNAIVMNEHYFGAQKDDFALIYMDQTINAGLMSNGCLYRGALGLNTGLSDLIVDIDDCGRTLRQNLSLPVLLKDTPWRTWAELLQNKNEPEARKVFDQLVKSMVFGVSNVIRVFAVPYVFLAGKLLEGTEPLFEQVNAEILKLLPLTEPPFRPAPITSLTRIAAAPLYHTLFRAG